jgi:hypothetical protein
LKRNYIWGYAYPRLNTTALDHINRANVFGRYPLRILAELPAILADGFREFPGAYYANAGRNGRVKEGISDRDDISDTTEEVGLEVTL